MIHFKSTVDLRILLPQTLLALVVADQQNPGNETFVTSVSDDALGRKPNSRHKSGAAFDLRLLSDVTANKIWVRNLKVILDHDYDIVLESNHIHVEWDPKPWAKDLQTKVNG